MEVKKIISAVLWILAAFIMIPCMLIAKCCYEKWEDYFENF